MTYIHSIKLKLESKTESIQTECLSRKIITLVMVEALALIKGVLDKFGSKGLALKPFYCTVGQPSIALNALSVTCLVIFNRSAKFLTCPLPDNLV